MKTLKTAFLDIHSWCGISADAEHWYGKIKWHYGRDGKRLREEHEVKRPLTAKEARHLNKKDRHLRAKYKPGDLTYRFNTKAEVVAAATDWYRENCPGCFLFQCDPANRSASPLLTWAANFKHADRVNALAAEWQRIGGYEGNEKRADAIDKEWQRLCEGVID